MYTLTRLMLIVTVVVAGGMLLAFTAAIPGAVLIAAVLLVCMKVRRRFLLTACGTGRWADQSDLRDMTGDGLIVGRMESRPSFLAGVTALFNPSVCSQAAVQQFLRKRSDLVRLWKAVHVSVFAPTGVGKGVSFVVPHALTCPDSMVIVDYKGENARLTAKARKAMGHRVILLDPFKLVTNTPDMLNPLDFIDAGDPLAIDECRDLAEALVVRTGQEREPHWNDSAAINIAAIAAAVVAFADPPDRSLQAVRDILASDGKRKQVIKLMQASTAWNGMLSRLGHGLANYVERELGSVLTSVARHLAFLDTLAVADSTRTSSFNPAELRTGKMTVYLILPPEHMRAQSPLLRMWLTSLLRAVVKGGLQT